MTVIREFSRTCATVSIPLPVRSRYATVRSSITAKVSDMPFGERFTRPSAPSGAVATKKMCWSGSQPSSLSLMRSAIVPMPPGYGVRR